MSVSRYKPRRRRGSGAWIGVAVVVALAAAVAVMYARQADAERTAPTLSDMDLEYVAVADTLPAQIVRYTGFTVSFNPELHIPNYVVWELTADEAEGRARRVSNFQVDNSVRGCASLADYRRSGFDRGHMAPAGDMKWSEQAMNDCHYLTNMAPQVNALNSGAWSTLEANCRRWALRDSAIVIVCGPVLTDKLTRTIGESEVVVPERFYKVVLAPYANPPRGIGFLMPNAKVRGGVQTTAVSIDEVERVTGYDFFSALPDEVETEVESQCNYPLWQRKI